MQRNYVVTLMAVATAVLGLSGTADGQAHYHKGATLHTSDRWQECSFQLSPSLTQAAWRQFTDEAGLVVYFRPLSDARPLGRGKFEISLLQWQTGIDDRDAAWNDTFVHPDSTHWLFDGHSLAFPGLTTRVGITSKMDVGIYVTKNPNANYGFVGGQVQRNLLSTKGWAAAGRVSYMTIYGPEDVDFAVYGADLLASRTVRLTRWATMTPYAGAALYVGSAHEKSAVVAVEDERAVGVHGTLGAALNVSAARIAAEYSVSKVNSLSFKVGFGR